MARPSIGSCIGGLWLHGVASNDAGTGERILKSWPHLKAVLEQIALTDAEAASVLRIASAPTPDKAAMDALLGF